MSLVVDLDDVDMFDSTLADSIVGNTRRYTNMLADVVSSLLPTYKVMKAILKQLWLVISMVLCFATI